MAFRSKTPLQRLPAFQVIRLQVVVTVLTVLLFLSIRGLVAGGSALVGALIALMPNLYFTAKTFRYFGARSVPASVLSLWAGEAGKFVLTAVLFALVFITLKRVDVVALFASYIVAVACSAVAVVLVKGISKR